MARRPIIESISGHIGHRRLTAFALTLLAGFTFATAGCSSAGNQPGGNAQAPNATSATAFNSSSTASGPALPTVTVKTREYSFEAPDSIPAGLTRVHMDNVGWITKRSC